MSNDEARVLDSKTILESRSFKISREQVQLPNGHQTTVDIVRHPGACAVVPILGDGRLVLLRQYRHAIGGWHLEIPCGKLDPGETPEECAARELEEESGFQPGRLESLGAIWPTPGFSDERIHLFLGTALKLTEQRLEPNEVVEVLTMPFDDALGLVHKGEILDGKTMIALALVAERRRSEATERVG